MALVGKGILDNHDVYDTPLRELCVHMLSVCTEHMVNR